MLGWGYAEGLGSLPTLAELTVQKRDRHLNSSGYYRALTAG